MLSAWRRLLSSSCDIVAAIAHGGEVLAAAVRLSPDVIVLDVNMGDQNGLDLCRQIKARMPATAVVLVSATLQDDLRCEAREAGASSFVSKFADVGELEAAIRSAVSR